MFVDYFSIELKRIWYATVTSLMNKLQPTEEERTVLCVGMSRLRLVIDMWLG